MNFRIFSAVDSFGGGERYLTLLIPELRRRNHSVDLVLAERAPQELRELMGGHAIRTKGPTVALYNGIGALYRWGWRISRAETHVYVSHSIIEDNQQSGVRRKLRPWLVRILSMRLNAIVRVCDMAVPTGLGFCPIHTVHNGVPRAAVSAVRRSGDKDFVVAMVGAINENKNQRAAIRILAGLPAGFRLRLIGAGPLLEELRLYASELGVEEAVSFEGHARDPVEYLKECHALLVLSKVEALPFAALEAMSAGVPVISYRIGGLPELISDGDTGLLVDRDDEAAVARLLLRLRNDENYRYHLSLGALEAVTSRFTIEAMVDGLLEVVRRNSSNRPLASW